LAATAFPAALKSRRDRSGSTADPAEAGNYNYGKISVFTTQRANIAQELHAVSIRQIYILREQRSENVVELLRAPPW
jgi:hypothetical protein